VSSGTFGSAGARRSRQNAAVFTSHVQEGGMLRGSYLPTTAIPACDTSAASILSVDAPSTLSQLLLL
jgi:hypothetical protein